MTDDLLNRIDATIDDWEAAPESWLPGDPLYDYPDPDADEQYARPMFELIPEHGPRPRCQPCQVSWDGDEPCFECGQPRPQPRRNQFPLLAQVLREVRTEEGSLERPPVPNFASSFAAGIGAAAAFEQAMARTAAAIAGILDRMPKPADYLQELARTLGQPARNGPPPLSIDGHAYRNRVRRRTRRNRR